MHLSQLDTHWFKTCLGEVGNDTGHAQQGEGRSIIFMAVHPQFNHNKLITAYLHSQ